MTEERSKTPRRKPSNTKGSQELRAALDQTKRRIQELAEESEADRRELAELRRVVAEQAEQLEALLGKVELVTSREEELRAMLLSAHDQLMRRAEKIKAELATELQRPAPPQSAPNTAPAPETPIATRPAEQNVSPQTHVDYERLSKYFAYRQLVGRIREVANAVLPSEATVAVVSKGDEELLELGGGRRGWHFPQNEEGAYAGYYPADSATAIAHLEELQGKGAGYLLLPESSFWWLESYREFGEYLDSHHRRVWDDGSYVIYELSEGAPPKGEGTP